MNGRRTARAKQDAADADDDNVHKQMLPIPLVTRICQRFEMCPDRTDIHTQISHATSELTSTNSRKKYHTNSNSASALNAPFMR